MTRHLEGATVGTSARTPLDVSSHTTARGADHVCLAPWLCSVALDAQTGRAYVSSNYGLYVVDYLKRLPPDVAVRNKAPAS